MAATDALTPKLDELVALFNARKIDLPHGLFHRPTQFRLNGAPFETLLGRDPEDPLVLMLARGPAGYRFAIKALQHAVPDAVLQRGELTATGDAATLSTRVWLSGHLRDTEAAVETVLEISVHLADEGWVAIANVAIDLAVLDQLRSARLAE